MAIEILPRLGVREEVSFAMSYENAKLIMDIRDKIGKIPAMRVLRMYNKNIGLRQAKEFVELLDLND
jgi:hypothetical protein